MASNYSYIHQPTNTLPFKSNSSSQIYGSIGSTERNNMGVLVTGPWPMSQPISPNIYNTTLNSKSRDVRNSQIECYESEQWVQQQRHQQQGSMRHHHSHGHLRPMSMPSSFASNRIRESTCYHNESAIEMVPLNLNSNNIHSAVPCRASFTPDMNPTSPPTCVPWLKKMKVIKKIQRKIGIGWYSLLTIVCISSFHMNILSWVC